MPPPVMVNTTAIASIADPSTSVTVTNPGLVNGDLSIIVGIAQLSGPPVWTVPTGHILWRAYTPSSGGVSLALFTRIANGSEAGTFAVTHNQAANAATLAGAMRISGQHATDYLGYFSDSSTAGANVTPVTYPPQSTDTDDCLAITIAGVNLASGSSVSHSVASGGVTEHQDLHSTAATGVRRMLVISSKQMPTKGAIDPVTGDLTAARPWIATTFFIRSLPAAVITNGVRQKYRSDNLLEMVVHRV